MLYTILIIVLFLLLLGALPSWPYSAGWGYYPSGGLGLLLIIVVVLLLVGRRA
ncbi:MAG TPA: DUF3309 family protein [Bryobacteraceae bacterium]